MQAQAAAMAADEKELQKKSEGYENYHSLGLPPGNVVWVLVSKTWKPQGHPVHEPAVCALSSRLLTDLFYLVEPIISTY